ncbi:hypothetical protein [Pseudonocardia sp. D17]|uniref:hypothetical protein n=1 Tax=Pseudonocardia sp. D17 TaxID=882661 RepID=UPI0030CC764A|nr:hypothetical protein PSD17_20530 [Pseudonocardia sp. D17]
MDSTTERLLLGVGGGAARLVWRAGRPLRFATTTLANGAVATVTFVAPRTTAALVRRGRRDRVLLARWWNDLFRLVVGQVVDALLRAVDLTSLVREHVEIDALAAGLDVDAVVARVDLDAVVARLDLDAVVRRLDLDAVVRRLDLDAVIAGVDLDAAVAGVDLERVVERIDVDRIVGQVDVDAVVSRVDLDRVLASLDVDQVAARLDVDAVLARVDLVGIAREVMDALDLPEIIRSSTGALTSDTVRAVRTEAMAADGAVSGAVDRLLRRGGAARRPAVP